MIVNPSIYGGGDLYWPYVISLLHFDGTTFVDQTGNTLTPSGNTSLSATQVKFGNKSCYFDGTNSRLTLTEASSGLFTLTGDFCFEFWVYLSSTLKCVWRAGSTGPYFYNGVIDGNGAFTNISYGGDTQNQWVHFAWSRGGSTMYVFKNGVQTGMTTSSATINLNVLKFGDYNSNLWLSGYVDDVRITKGVARYTSNFTPPSVAFPNFQ